MDKETDKIVTLYAIGADLHRSSFKLYTVKAKLSYLDSSYEPGETREVYELIEDHKEYFGRAGRQWYNDGAQASTDPDTILKFYYCARRQEINRLMNKLQDQMNWLKSLDKIGRDLEHAKA